MAIALSAKQNVSAPDATYPYGNIKDNSGLNDGTPVNKAVYADFHQFFARMLNQAGITANGLPENTPNTYQYFLALIANIRATLATETAAGTAEIATTAETNTGTDDARMVTPLKLSGRTATETRTGIAEIATTAETNTGTDDVRFVTPLKLAGRTATETRAGIAEIATTGETSLGSDDTRIVTPLKLREQFPLDTWHAPSLINSFTNYGSGLQEVRYKKDGYGGNFVVIEGVLTNGTSGTVAFVLPVGYRPVADQIFAMCGDITSGYIQVGSNGDVQLNWVSGTGFRSLGCIRFGLI